MKNVAIILAAGKGTRISCATKKQFMQLNNKPVIYYSLKAFEESSVEEIIIVTAKSDIEYCKDSIVKKYGFKKVGKIVEGGEERYLSVYKGLMEIDQCKNVLIHDSARPMITPELIEQLIEKMSTNKAVIVGMPVKDTIKLVDEEGYVKETPNRNYLWQVQTPQVFDLEIIKEAYSYLISEGISDVTDDGMVLERYYKNKLAIQMVAGSYENIKITTDEDIQIAESFLAGKKL